MCLGIKVSFIRCILNSYLDFRHRMSWFPKLLFVPATRQSSLSDRAFPVAAARSWNTLPVSLRTVLSYLTFLRELKTFLFNISFPDN